MSRFQRNLSFAAIVSFTNCFVYLAGTLQAAPIVYNAVTDFSQSINTASSTWSYRYQSIPGDVATTRSSGATTLLPVGNDTYVNTTGGNIPTGWDKSTGSNPGILLSTAARSPLFGLLDVAANTLYVAPSQSAGGGEVLSWLAPGPGTISISFSATNSHQIRNATTNFASENWYLDQNSSATNLATGTLGFYGTPAATSGTSLSGIVVSTGDRINASFDGGGKADDGWIGFTETITFTQATPEPSTFVLGSLGLAALLAVRRRRA